MTTNKIIKMIANASSLCLYLLLRLRSDCVPIQLSSAFGSNLNVTSLKIQLRFIFRFEANKRGDMMSSEGGGGCGRNPETKL